LLGPRTNYRGNVFPRFVELDKFLEENTVEFSPQHRRFLPLVIENSSAEEVHKTTLPDFITKSYVYEDSEQPSDHHGGVDLVRNVSDVSDTGEDLGEEL